MTRFKFGVWITAMCSVLCVGVSSAWAKNLYVQAKRNPHSHSNGTESKPFTSLAEVEASSRPGDAIFVLPSTLALDGGIQLKNGQSLIGVGPRVTRVSSQTAHAKISNSTNDHLSGDAIRLAHGNTVKNIHVIGAYRAGILGVNVASPEIEDNLITENMNQHSIQTLQEDFIIFQTQRNHYAAITLLACGAASPNECQDEDANTAGIAWQRAVIRGNEIHDVNVEGIVILNDAGVVTSYDVKDNHVSRVSLGFAGFKTTDLLPPLTAEVVRSRAFTLLVGNGAHATLDMNDFHATRLAPEGDFASDGVVLVTFGDGGVISSDISDLTITNPDWTGEIANGDSLELTSFGSNAIFDVRVKRALLTDSVNTLVKLLEVGAVNGNSFFFDIKDSVLSNENPRARVTDARGALAYLKIPATGAVSTDTVDISIRNTKMLGHLRGLLVQNLNSVHLGTLNLVAENSTFADNTAEGVRIFNQNGVIDHVNIDLGGGPLGSDGRNSFTNNGEQADLAVINLNLDDAPLEVYASNNFWGGSAPVTGLGANLYSSGPVEFTVDGYLTSAPNPSLQ